MAVKRVAHYGCGPGGYPLFQSLVADAFRLRTLFTQSLALVGLIFLVVAVEEGPLRIAFGSQDVRGDAVKEPAVVRNCRRRTGGGGVWTLDAYECPRLAWAMGLRL